LTTVALRRFNASSSFSAWQHRITDKTDGRISRIKGMNTLFCAHMSGIVRKCGGVCDWINERRVPAK
jgi:hypothetical protein